MNGTGKGTESLRKFKGVRVTSDFLSVHKLSIQSKRVIQQTQKLFYSLRTNTTSDWSKSQPHCS